MTIEPAPRPHAARNRRRLEIAAVLGGLWIGLVVLAPSLFGQRTVVPADLVLRHTPWAEKNVREEAEEFPSNTALSDAAFQQLPWALVVREALGQGTMPFWNPFFRSGMPLLGNGQSAPFSPVMLPARIFPPATGFALVLLLKLTVLWSGAWLYGRSLGLGGAACLMVSVSFLFAPQILSWGQHPNSNALVFFPWMLCFVERMAARRGAEGLLRDSVCLSAVQAAQLAGGHFQASLSLIVGTTLYAIARTDLRLRLRSLGMPVAVCASLFVGTLLAAPAILPFLDALSRSATLGSRLGDSIGLRPLLPDAMPLLWNPMTFGSPVITSPSYWSNEYEVWSDYQQYTGLLPTAFAIGGVWFAASRMRVPHRRAALAWLLLSVFGVVMAWGISPLHGLVGGLPGFSLNRNIRFSLLYQIGVPVVACLVFDTLRTAKTGAPTTRTDFLFAESALGLALVSFGLGWADQWEFRPPVAGAAAVFALLAVLVGGSRRRLVPWVVPVVLLADVGPVWKGYFPQPPRVWLDEALYVPASLFDPSTSHLPRMLVADWAAPNTPTFAGYGEIRGYDFPVAMRHELFMTRIAGAPTADQIPGRLIGNVNFLRALLEPGPGRLVTGYEAEDFPLWLEAEYSGRLPSRLRVFRLRNPKPRAEWYPEVSIDPASDAEEAVSKTRSNYSRARSSLVVETSAEVPDNSDSRTPRPADLRWLDFNTVAIDLPRDIEAPGWLYVRNSWDSGWTAEDQGGAPLEIRPARVKFMAVRVPPATQTVFMRFEPPGFRSGLWIALAGGLVWTAGAGLLLVRRRPAAAFALAGN